jgi:ATP-dependent DNA ligase
MSTWKSDGPDVFHHACMLGLEGIVSKRKDSQYRSGRSPHWIKSKNPNAPAVTREPEEHILGSVTVDAGVCEPKGAHQLR